MNYVALKDVNADSHNWTVKTRVVRFTDFMSLQDPSKRYRVDMVLLDEEGTSMEAQVPEHWMVRFGPQLKEDRVYYIQFFEVLHARQMYRATDHSFMARFTPHTRVQEVASVPTSFPLYAYSAVSFDILRTRVHDDRVTSDTFGILTGCSHVQDKSVGAGTRPLRTLRISDGRETVDVALWGNHALSFEAQIYMDVPRRHPPVILFCGLRCRLFNERLSLQNSSVCRWYVDPNLPEALELRARTAALPASPVWLDSAPAATNTEPTTVTGLASLNNPHLILARRYVVAAKLKCMISGQSWWYFACSLCNKGMKPEGDSYKCSGKTCLCTSGAPRYRLAMRAVDPTVLLPDNAAPSIELVFFGPVAEEVIGARVDDLISLTTGIGDSIPQRISDLVGRSYDLRVSASKSSLRRTEVCYQVDSVLRVHSVTSDCLVTATPALCTTAPSEPSSSKAMPTSPPLNPDHLCEGHAGPAIAVPCSPSAPAVTPLARGQTTLPTTPAEAKENPLSPKTDSTATTAASDASTPVIVQAPQYIEVGKKHSRHESGDRTSAETGPRPSARRKLTLSDETEAE